MADVKELLAFLLRDFRDDKPAAATERAEKNWAAWSHYAAEEKSTAAARHEEDVLYLRAMIASAGADGHVDVEEKRRVLARLDSSGLSDLERRFIIAELEDPTPIHALAGKVSSPEMARRLYAASLAAVVVDSPAEREYLHSLAERLGLDGATVNDIHRRFGVPLPDDPLTA